MRLPDRSNAGFQTCCIAGIPACGRHNISERFQNLHAQPTGSQRYSRFGNLRYVCRQKLSDSCRVLLLFWLSVGLAISLPCCAETFFSNPLRLANLYPVLWETSPIGTVWSDDFNRASLGTNWVILGSANASILSNELQLSQTNTDYSRQVYYQPWLTCSHNWTLRWTERFSALNSGSLGIGVGLKNFQAAGGTDRGYNAWFSGAGTSLGKMQIEKFTGSSQSLMAAGSAISFAAGDTLDCALARSFWTLTATASNRANAQVSSVSFTFTPSSDALATPTISRFCIYPLGGIVIVDNWSFSIDRRKPARFILIGASTAEGYLASAPPKTFISVVQSNYTEAVCNDSCSYNTTTNSLSTVPEILAYQPGTAILMIGGNDLYFNYPASQWQSSYSNIVVQLQGAGARIKHCLPPPRNTVNLIPLRDWILTNYPAKDIIDTWTPFVTNTSSLKPIYDSGDGVHQNDAGHLLLGLIIRTNLP
jgi:hypothetical protein